MKLIFATNNAHKVHECRIELTKLPNLQLLTLNEVNILEDIPETQPTIEGNAIQKATYIFSTYGFDCFADDTGLEITALNGEPGVFSARYAGAERSYEKNNALVLKKMEFATDRSARFKTVMALLLRGKLFTFEGIVTGEILRAPIGEYGFGYDPIFKPAGFNKSMAQFTDFEKNEISHRGIATRALAAFLEKRFAI